MKIITLSFIGLTMMLALSLPSRVYGETSTEGYTQTSVNSDVPGSWNRSIKVVPGVITSMPVEPTLPTTITMEVLSKRQIITSGVNNHVGDPGDIVTVSITEDTKLRKRFMGEALLSEFSVGDEIHVLGRYDETSDTLNAELIRNASIELVPLTLMGEATEVNASSSTITMQRVRGTDEKWKVIVTEETEIKKEGEGIPLEDVKAGDFLKVKGVVKRAGVQEIYAHAVWVITDESPVVNNTEINQDEAIILGNFLHGKTDTNVMIHVASDTKIYKDGKLIPLSELTIGGRIKVAGRIERDGTTTHIYATEIIVVTEEQRGEGLALGHIKNRIKWALSMGNWL